MKEEGSEEGIVTRIGGFVGCWVDCRANDAQLKTRGIFVRFHIHGPRQLQLEGDLGDRRKKVSRRRTRRCGNRTLENPLFKILPKPTPTDPNANANGSSACTHASNQVHHADDLSKGRNGVRLRTSPRTASSPRVHHRPCGNDQ